MMKPLGSLGSSSSLDEILLQKVLDDIGHADLALRLLLRLGLVVLELITHQHEGTLLPVANEVTLLGEIALLDNALALVIEGTQLVDDRAQFAGLAGGHFNLEPVVSQHLLSIITVSGVHDLLMKTSHTYQ